MPRASSPLVPQASSPASSGGVSPPGPVAGARTPRHSQARRLRYGEHTRPRVWLAAPSQPASARVPQVVKYPHAFMPPGFSARARKTVPEGGCAPHSLAGARTPRHSQARRRRYVRASRGALLVPGRDNGTPRVVGAKASTASRPGGTPQEISRGPVRAARTQPPVTCPNRSLPRRGIGETGRSGAPFPPVHLQGMDLHAAANRGRRRSPCPRLMSSGAPLAQGRFRPAIFLIHPTPLLGRSTPLLGRSATASGRPAPLRQHPPPGDGGFAWCRTMAEGCRTGEQRCRTLMEGCRLSGWCSRTPAECCRTPGKRCRTKTI